MGIFPVGDFQKEGKQKKDIILRQFLASIIAIFIIGTQSVVLAESNPGTSAMNFSNLGHSVQSISLGFSQVARLGSRAMSVNPSSIADEKNREFLAQYVSYIEDILYKNLSVVAPFKSISIAIDAGMIDYGLQDRTTMSNESGDSLGTFQNAAYQVLVGVAKKINTINSGVSLRYLQETLDGRNIRALGLNSGLSVDLNKKWRLGAAINNLTLTKAKALYSSDTANLDTELRLGALYKTTIAERYFSISTDIIKLSDDGYHIGIGLSHDLNSILQVQAGYNTVSDISQFSVGLGLTLSQAKIDFAYRPGGLFGPSYRLGLGIGL
jgi:hypothetical protein